jgi:hypothetical protein
LLSARASAQDSPIIKNKLKKELTVFEQKLFNGCLTRKNNCPISKGEIQLVGVEHGDPSSGPVSECTAGLAERNSGSKDKIPPVDCEQPDANRIGFTDSTLRCFIRGNPSN